MTNRKTTERAKAAVQQPVIDYWFWYQNRCRDHNRFRCEFCKPNIRGG